jgi:tetratricopeptide (TPR) repeat protein
MASVFLSYDRDDAERARHFARVLEAAGHTVWWDLRVRGGAEFSKVIEEALQAANAVVVLWSKNAIDSAWVRDEAAAGRDSGRLVPVTIDGTEPPLGFRQFQTIDLSKWKGRGTPPALKTLLGDIHALGDSREDAMPPPERPLATATKERKLQGWLIPGAAAAVLILAALSGWLWWGRNSLPVVEVMAANSTLQSQAVASDLFVKLGSLAQVGDGKWQLVDASAGEKSPDLIFRTADTSAAAKPQVNLVLLDGGDNGLLWSREFSPVAGTAADLRQQLSLTAGRVLGCALESRAAGGLKRDLLKLFLNACAALAETSTEDPESVSATLRTIVAQSPRFAPAWARLLTVDASMIDLSSYLQKGSPALTALRADLAKARSVAPDLPEITVAEAATLEPSEYGKQIGMLEKARGSAPNSTAVLASLSTALMSVGRMDEAADAAARAAELDPLSPATETQRIMTLAYAGQLDEARERLTRAEKVWAGTGALRDALWAFHLRYGDPHVAEQYAPQHSEATEVYLHARLDKSPASIERLAAFIRPYAAHAQGNYMAWSTQALAEFGRTDDVFAWMTNTPTAQVAATSYVFFRPAFDRVRRDLRFMAMARRIGLADYWLKSGKWPDYCQDPALPYDCKAEAAKRS